jgi:hypothetical protein
MKFSVRHTNVELVPKASELVSASSGLVLAQSLKLRAWTTHWFVWEDFTVEIIYMWTELSAEFQACI